jgi:fermentation-respiration switch protein FrsA (DUF1100 family)
MALLKAVLLAVVVGYLAIATLVWLVQERLIFMPVGVAAPARAPAGWRLEEVSLAARDGTRLAGVLLLPPTLRPPLVIYYGGNAEEATASASQAQATYGERALLLMNYRGYGESGGRPGEKALIADAVELFDWAAARPDIDRARIALHGRSLGTAIAVAVAAARAAKCVVLTSPFASARDVAAEIYPWLPVSWMLRHPFDSGRLAPGIASPALILAGEDDTIIPKRHSDRLAAAWGGPVERASFAGFGHNDLDLNPRYAQAIREFLDRCA